MVLSVSHKPERSGFLSAARGVGAVRLGLPSAVLGTPAVGYFNHWAPAVAGQTRAALTAIRKHAERAIDLGIMGHQESLHCTELNVDFSEALARGRRGARSNGGMA